MSKHKTDRCPRCNQAKTPRASMCRDCYRADPPPRPKRKRRKKRSPAHNYLPSNRRPGRCEICGKVATRWPQDRDGSRLRLCSTCPDPRQIDAARDKIKFAWSRGEERSRRAIEFEQFSFPMVDDEWQPVGA
jgi:hypothetical protein